MKDIEILTGDFRELSRDLPDGSVDLILTDPPYPERYLPLWGDLGALGARVLKPSHLMVAYSGQMYLPEIFKMLGEHLDYFWLAALHHPGGQGRVWNRGVFNAMKSILFYARPPIAVDKGRWFSDLVTSPAASKTHHEWGQSLEPVRYLIERLTKPGDLVLDPFLGGGTTAVAAHETGRRCIGYELDPDQAQIARNRLAGTQLSIFGAPVLDALTKEHEPRARLATCQHCGDEFATGRADARYCPAGGCRQAAYRKRRAYDPATPTAQYERGAMECQSKTPQS